MSRVTCLAGEDGALACEVHATPAELPPVTTRVLEAAWDMARDAVLTGACGPPRAFRFPRAGGGWTVLRLCDRQARGCAGAIDRMVGLHTLYGVATCLRLLALLDLVAARAGAAELARCHSGGVRPDPALLRLAAEAPLTDEAGLDALNARPCAVHVQTAEEPA